MEKCNETLVDDTMKKVVFIGVLDIAGFEIFEVNIKKFSQINKIVKNNNMIKNYFFLTNFYYMVYSLQKFQFVIFGLE